MRRFSLRCFYRASDDEALLSKECRTSGNLSSNVSSRLFEAKNSRGVHLAKTLLSLASLFALLSFILFLLFAPFLFCGRTLLHSLSLSLCGESEGGESVFVASQRSGQCVKGGRDDALPATAVFSRLAHCLPLHRSWEQYSRPAMHSRLQQQQQ